MIYTLIVTILMIVISYFKFRNLFNPIFVLGSSFFIFIILVNLRLYGLYKGSTDAYIMLSIGLFSFTIGAIVFELLLNKYRMNVTQFSYNNVSKSIKKSYKTILILLGIAVVSEIILSIDSITYLLQGQNLYTLRYVDLSTIQNDTSLISIIHIYFAVPVLFISLPISCIEFFCNKNRQLFYLSTIGIVFYMLTDGARMPLVYFLINIIITFLLFKNQLIKEKKFRKILLYIIVAIIVIASISSIRAKGGGNTFSFIESMYLYLAGGIVNLSEKLKNVGIDTYKSHGAISLYGFINLLNQLKEIVIGNGLDSIKEAEKFLLCVQTDLVYINEGGRPYNFVTTGFLYFFADFGIYGVIIFSLLFGFVSQKVYRKVLYRPNLGYIVLYSLMLESIIMFVLTDIYSNNSFVIAVIFTYIFLIFMKKVRWIL